MLKFKAFLVVTIIAVFSFSLVGCGLLTSRSAEPVEEVSEGELPEWLLLAYRADDSDVAEKNETAGEVKEPPAETTQPTAATTQPASGSTAPAASAPASTTASLEDEVEERMNDILRVIYADELALAELKAKEDALKAEKAKEDDERGYANWWKN